MRKILCLALALVLILCGCSAPEREPQWEPQQVSGGRVCGIYELSFTADSPEGWDVIYTYYGEQVTNGHRIRFPLELFSFHAVYVEAVERANPENVYGTSFMIAVCDGGSGETELTVADNNGHTETIAVSCLVTCIGTENG